MRRIRCISRWLRQMCRFIENRGILTDIYGIVNPWINKSMHCLPKDCLKLNLSQKNVISLTSPVSLIFHSILLIQIVFDIHYKTTSPMIELYIFKTTISNVIAKTSSELLRPQTPSTLCISQVNSQKTPFPLQLVPYPYPPFQTDTRQYPHPPSSAWPTVQHSTLHEQSQAQE